MREFLSLFMFVVATSVLGLGGWFAFSGNDAWMWFLFSGVFLFIASMGFASSSAKDDDS